MPFLQIPVRLRLPDSAFRVDLEGIISRSEGILIRGKISDNERLSTLLKGSRRDDVPSQVSR